MPLVARCLEAVTKIGEWSFVATCLSLTVDICMMEQPFHNASPNKLGNGSEGNRLVNKYAPYGSTMATDALFTIK